MSSYFRTFAQQNPGEAIIRVQEEFLARKKSGFGIDDNGSGRTYSLESFIEQARTQGAEGVDVKRTREVVRAVIDSSYGEGTFDNEFTDGQRDVAVLAAAAALDPERAYRNASPNLESFKSGTERFGDTIVNSFGLPQVGRGGGDWQFQRRQHNKALYSNESFDDRKLTEFAHISVGFHILAARQSPAAEAMYPTYAMAPDQTGFQIEVSRPLVFNQIWHDESGKAIDFNKKRKLLLLAYQDHTILQNTATKLKLYYTDENKDNFVDAAIAPPTKYGKGPDEDFLTSWISVDREVSLISLGMHPELARLGKANTTDTLDQRITLSQVLVEVETNDGKSYIPFNVEHLAYTQFNPAMEDHHSRMNLTFTNSDMVLHREIKDVEGNTPVALTTFINNYPDARMTFKVNVNGNIILESSSAVVQNAVASKNEVYTVTGTGTNAEIEPLEDDEANTVKELFKSIKVIGYKLTAFLTNFNRAIHGPLVTTERFRDVHMVPLGAPITAQIPVVDAANHSVDVTAPAQTLMIRNTNNAFSQLFNFEEVLEVAQLAYSGRNATVPQIRAIGRYLLARSWYDKQRLVLTDEINSLTTADRNDNISSGICNKLRMMINTGYYYTNFQAAMEVMGITAGAKPKIVLVCNPIVSNYLYTKGDSRTLGDGWEFDIVPDPDRRLIDRDEDGNEIYRVYAFFKVDGIDGPHSLNFGNMIYKPDLATSLPITRDQRTTVEFTVQPWTLHVNHCPVLFRLDIVGLNEATTDSMPIRQTIV